MKKVKKLLSVLFALVMVFTLNVPVFAAGNGDNQQDSDDTATISVTNVEAGATVTAYQIVKPVYNGSGLDKYVAVLQKKDADGNLVTDADNNPVMVPADVSNPTEAEIEELASRLDELTTSVTLDRGTIDEATNTATYSKEVGAGSYLVIITGTSEKTYNPIIVSASYATDATDLTGGSVDSTTNAELNGGTAYAKSSDTTIDKNIVKDDGTKVKGDDTETGDTVNYEITGEIPSFTEQYDNPVYTITDTPDDALSIPESITVTVGGSPVNATENDGTVNYTFTRHDTDTDHYFTVAFSSAYIKSLENTSAAQRAVVITFSSTLNHDKADVDFDPNDNTAKVTWGNDTNSTQDSDEVKTHTYTFAIDMNINGSGSKDTHEVTKTGEDYITGSETIHGPLKGATFELRDSTGKVIDSGTTDDGGHVALKGMEADKTYTLVETDAPAGYSTDSTPHTVKVTDLVLDSNGKLTQYTITIDSKSFTYTLNSDGTISGINDGSDNLTYQADKDPTGDKDDVVDDDTVLIENTKIPGLPSTGGIGTYIFTIAGGALIAIAIALLIVNKRKKA
ncbi:MAG: isopeptide-forming domain-containing fimbrial protein [Bilifractor sp.]|jgi:fimbrial isopeptide formation D2 family protein/LPXTG-motif cell wall-anchored protein